MRAHRCHCGFVQNKIQSHCQNFPCAKWTPNYSLSKICTSQDTTTSGWGAGGDKSEVEISSQEAKEPCWLNGVSLWKLEIWVMLKRHELCLGGNNINHLLEIVPLCKESCQALCIFLSHLTLWDSARAPWRGGAACVRSRPRLARHEATLKLRVGLWLCHLYLSWSA